MGRTAASPQGETGRTPTDRTPAPSGDGGQVDQSFRSLLEGLRTTLPGVEVLLAFLLVLPLQTGFDDADVAQRTIYLVAVLSSALSAVLLIAPSAHQRVRALRSSERHDSGVPRRHPDHVRAAVRTSLVGTGLAVVAMTSAVMLATSFILQTWIGMLIGLAVGGVAAWTWFWTPAVAFEQESSDREIDVTDQGNPRDAVTPSEPRQEPGPVGR